MLEKLNRLDFAPCETSNVNETLSSFTEIVFNSYNAGRNRIFREKQMKFHIKYSRLCRNFYSKTYLKALLRGITLFFDCTYYIWNTLIDGSPSNLSVNHALGMPIKSVLEDLPKTSTLHAVVFVLSNCLHPQGTVFQTPLGNLVETAAQHSFACSVVNRRASPRWGSNT